MMEAQSLPATVHGAGNVTSARLSELEERIVDYLRDRGESCLSRLSIDLSIPPKHAHDMVRRLAATNVLEERPSPCTSAGDATDGESRWGLKTIHFPRLRRLWRRVTFQK